MITQVIPSILLISSLAISSVANTSVPGETQRTFAGMGVIPMELPFSVATQKEQVVMGSRAFSLDKRLANKYLNDVYKDNILLNLAYMREITHAGETVNWDLIHQPFKYEFNLKPGERFAYHDSIQSEYGQNVVKLTNSHFDASEGYKTDGRLYGMGVCHMASVIHWAAKDAGLESIAPSNHDFAVINEVPKEYGVAIYSNPNSHTVSSLQNLYITNNQDKEVTFRFEFDGDNLRVTVLKSS
jgi:hypothetical protein